MQDTVVTQALVLPFIYIQWSAELWLVVRERIKDKLRLFTIAKKELKSVFPHEQNSESESVY